MSRSILVTAPGVNHRIPGDQRLFLAGGITGATDWQKAIWQQHLSKADLVVFNPRRQGNFKRTTGSTWKGIDPKEQIRWEQDAMEASDAILFWFPENAPCMITLFELGSWVKMRKPIFVGIHPKYMRKLDVEIQLEKLAPSIEIVYSIKALAGQVIRHFKY